MWAPVLIVLSALLVVASLAATGANVRRSHDGMGCLAILLAAVAFWTTVGAAVCLWVGI